ncbi:hypothetical protein Ait01nite_028440 [Actinoplanes italicus]|uniref:Uncharacterized protein n=1 Tax=Actinoplanes italicus TaxID=113567 RepID=A0A2T0KIE9_9ACTN|nr:hypothetical protein CLV67_10341 [Actinoplanes italicus]GIE29799.1 hypothetical protein Ait01nite_028440 [Actinoplanes italicus]
MTRTVRARRAERPHQPLYARVLRLRHLAPSGLLCFVFLEGAVVLGILLALAELVSWWGVIVLPITVALMVKFNDLVAGALTPRPAAGAATSARASVLRPATMGQPAAPAAPVSADPGGASRFDGHGPAVAPYSSFANRAGHGEWSAGYAPVVSQESSAFGYGSAIPPDAPAVGYPGSYSRGLSSTAAGSRSHDGDAGYPVRSSVEPVVEEARGNNAPVRRAWADQDVRQQMARQAASRRYE